MLHGSFTLLTTTHSLSGNSSTANFSIFIQAIAFTLVKFIFTIRRLHSPLAQCRRCPSPVSTQVPDHPDPDPAAEADPDDDPDLADDTADHDADPETWLFFVNLHIFWDS